MAEQKLDDLAAKVSALQASVDKMLAGETLPIPQAGMPSLPPSGAITTRATSTGAPEPLAELDRRIANAPVSDAVQLIYVRQEIVRQQEVVVDRAHIRSLETRNFYAKVGLSVAAFASGIGLVVTGFGLPGFVCLGAGLYTIAPTFIDRVTDLVVGEKKQ